MDKQQAESGSATLLLASAISDTRSALGWSLQKLADRSGLSKAHVWELEQGRAKNPTISSLLAIGRATGRSVSELLGEDVCAPSLHPIALRVALDVDAEIRALKGEAS